MKKLLFLITSLLLTSGLFAQERIIFYNGNIPVHTQLIENTDSVSFVNGISILHNNIGETDFTFPVSAIDSIIFSTQDTPVDTGNIIYITYAENTVSIINPWANRGVTVTNNGADVTVNALSGNQDIIYYLSGTTSDGSLLINSDLRFNLIMDGVSITNPSGAAIKVLDDVKVSITLKNSSSLSDGTSSTDKGAMDSKGQLVISGTNGTLALTGTVKHGLYSSDYIRLLSGTINVNSAVSDGIHSNDYIEIFGGNIHITNAATGIDAGSRYINISGGNIDIIVAEADGKGIKCDSIVNITGGDISLTLTGAQSKGIKSGTNMEIQGGNITINGSGATVVTANDPSHCTGLKCNGNLVISDLTGTTDMHITMSNGAAGGKGINADGSVTINGGNIELSVAGNGGTYTNTSNQSDTYSASCIKTNGNIEINGGTITVTASGTDSKGLSADGSIYVNDGTITATASGVDSKGLASDNSINFYGAHTTVTASGNSSKAISSDLDMLVEDGTIDITASGATVVTSGNPSYCSGMKTDGALTINDGSITVNCTNTNTGGRCLSSNNLYINGGDLNLTTSGSGTTYTSGSTTDGYGPICIKADANATILGGVIDCQSTGTGGRGMKVEGNLVIGAQGADNDLIDIDIMTSGAPLGGGGGGGGWPPSSSSTTYCSPKGIKCLGNITINSGHVSSYCAQTSGDPTGEAIESKAKITINGGFIEANAYDDAINSATGFVVTGGYVWAYARGNDGIDNNGTSTAQATNLTGGVIIAAGTEEAIDANIDRGGSFYINGATVIGFYASSGGMGGGGMGIFDSPQYQNGQKYLAPSITTAGSYCIKNSGGNPVMIYTHTPSVTGSGFMSSTGGLRPPGGGGGGSSSARFIFTSPNVTSGTYTLYSNPTINGTDHWHGLYIGASATTSGSGTSVTAQ